MYNFFENIDDLIFNIVEYFYTLSEYINIFFYIVLLKIHHIE